MFMHSGQIMHYILYSGISNADRLFEGTDRKYRMINSLLDNGPAGLYIIKTQKKPI